MDTIELKTNFHKLIDTIDNENLLSTFYEIMISANEQEDGLLWTNLSFEDRKELIEIESDSRNNKNLISNADILAKHKKWI